MKEQTNKWWQMAVGLMVCLLLSVNSYAQKQSQDVVHLENGSIIKGKVLEYEPKGKIKIEIQGGSILVYEGADVVKLEKEEIEVSQQNSTGVKSIGELKAEIKAAKRRNAHKMDKGYYVSIMAGTLAGMSEWGGPEPGISLNAIAGYHFNQYIGVGGGIGIGVMGARPFVPVYANIRGYLMKTSTSIFYDVNVGYGIALKEPFSMWANQESAHGGLYVRPAIGIRFPSSKRSHVVMDFGYVIQFARYEYTDWSNNPISERRAFYRPSLRVGVVF